MLICIEDVLSPDQVASFAKALAVAPWVDGRVTAGMQSGSVKHNMQLPESCPTAQQLGAIILEALGKNPLFLSAALPARIFPPLFNRYEGGGYFGTHVDNAIRRIPATSDLMRTDLSATLFLTDPDEYDGGELVIEGHYGVQHVKLPAGHMVLYPASSLHHVTPVTRGSRISSFFWMQSMVADVSRRALLFDMDQTIQALATERGVEDALVVSFSGIYHNLIRQWAQW